MRQYKSYITIILMACTLLSTSCSDEYMESMNTDPSKAATIDPNAQLTTAQLQIYGDIEAMETFRSYIYAFNQQLMGCWNTTNYGGRHTIDHNEMGHIWQKYYLNSIKNVTDAQLRTTDDAEKVNINAALRIYRVYLMSLMTDIYGDVPYSEAGRGFIESKFTPKYDTQEDIYNDFFVELDAAVTALDATKDRITGDVIYKGDISKWKKFANSLHLRYAMRISDANPQKAQEEFEKALAADGGIFTSGADDALIPYMDIAFSFGGESYTDYRRNALSQLFFGNDPLNNPSFICSTLYNQLYSTGDPRFSAIIRFYFDKTMNSTDTEGRIDISEEVLAKGMAHPRDPGAFFYEPWPASYESDLIKELQKNDPSIEKTSMDTETEPKLANNFLTGDNPGVVITSAEVNFLLAEASLKGWNVPGTVEDYYRKGVRAAIDFLTDNYECDAVSDIEFNNYMNNNNIGYTSEQKKASINTQAWILHFTNPLECWANLRRSNYPRLKSPADYGFSQVLTGGPAIPVRLCYPVIESSYNKKNYEEALSRMGGNNSWNTPVWWDKNNAQ
ncbi:SusD/RagB family nutrient-binding outer membrane lipoprotein [Bacteroides sp.]|uniref:SusD/RagB family nutrient-binding outer membrane lipoprotein n=1 Tax=Bacteroides sp. TaxID=29523 RepID=UPI002619595B|nr:SusD/RagB family nutrient-binding outer membrane lipoprotein [Bacteroides sp.]